MSKELEELVDSKIEELKMVLTGLISTYLKSQSNSFLKTKDYQSLVTDKFLDLDNELQNRDTWDKDEILEMAVLFLLMTVDEDIEEVDNSEEETEEVIDVKAE